MKKIAALVLTLAVALGLTSNAVLPETDEGEPPEPVSALSIESLNVGDYFTLGKFDGESILWRCMPEDEHGKLAVSDKVISWRPAGNNNFWEDSYIRKWLNSEASEGEVNWAEGLSGWVTDEINANEKGFLHESNFTEGEKKVIKEVTQWTMLPSDHLGLATNGNDKAYIDLKFYRPGSPIDGGFMIEYEISELAEAYQGAAYELTDRIFLLDEMQVYRIWETFSEIRAQGTEKLIRETSPLYMEDGYFGYFLRTPAMHEGNFTAIYDSGRYTGSNAFFSDGIRPAFYLDEANAIIKSGSGTAEDPYIVDGRREIQVFMNGAELTFDVPPVIENDRTLVPFRAIFEALGAEVGWDEAAETVTGKLNETTIALTIGSETAVVNSENILLDVPPKILNDRTLVPLRFVSENFGYQVDWNAEEQRIDIITLE